ncbi:hypothetical protein BH23ACT4_BH23ACT4_01220 [soil metagenome]
MNLHAARVWGLFLGGVALFLALTLPILAKGGWDPTVFVKFPESFPEFVVYGEELLGEIRVAPEAGHDGKFYFVQAMDPFYLAPDENAIFIDRPTYRAQRMLYPTLAGAAGLAGPWATVWALYGLNIVLIGLGCVVTGMVAKQLGASELFGLGFGVNLGMLSAGLVDTAEILGFALLMLGLYLCLRQSWKWMTVALTLSVLARETMLAGVVGIAVYLLMTRRRIPRHLVWAIVLPLAWFAYLQVRIGYLPGYDDTASTLGLPLFGFVEAFGEWISEPVQFANLATGVIFMALAVLFVVRVVRKRDILTSVGAPFFFVALLMSVVVWRQAFDSSRALAPLMTLYILSIPLKRSHALNEHQEQTAPCGEHS